MLNSIKLNLIYMPKTKTKIKPRLKVKPKTEARRIKINTEENDDILEPEFVEKVIVRKKRVIDPEEAEEKEEEIEESLAKIYEDNKGRKIEVDKLKIRKKRSFVFWFFNFLVIGMIIVVASLGVYYYVFYSSGTDSTAVEFSVESDKNVSVNEEFYYTIHYENASYVALKNVSIEASYPDNFIFLDSSVVREAGTNIWRLGRVAPKSKGEIKIKGKIIDKPKTSGIMFVSITYTPENFSSIFEKEASANTVIADLGFEAEIDYSKTVLVDEETSFIISLKALEENYIDEFIIRMEADENVKIKKFIVNDDEDAEEAGFSLEARELLDKKSWLVSGVSENKEKLEIKYEINEKIGDNQKVKFYFELREDAPFADPTDEEVKEKEGEVVQRSVIFYEEEIMLEVMKSDLNLVLILNGSQEDGTVDFEEELNYSVAYANKGEATMNNVSIMMVLDSDFLNWTTLEDENMGKERGNTITWTKEEIPELGKIEVEDKGVIDFSLKVMPFSESDLGKNFKVLSYAQYNIGSLEKLGEINTSSTSTAEIESDNRSNTILSVINSDLKLKEEIRYFDENNMPVGSGPLPPQVGEKSSFKIFWTLNNNLHELKDVKVETVLPSGVVWDEKNRTSVGNIDYNEGENKVVWQIGRLPITVFRADAEFNISITPDENDRNKIMVLSTGAEVEAIDAKTNDIIKRSTGPKTTKLEDDEIASLSSDGRVK